MAKRKNTISTRKKFRWGALLTGLPGFFIGSFAWAVLVLFLAGAGLGVREVVYADPLMKLKGIDVFPADALSTEKMEALQKKYLGKNTFQINLRALARDLKADHRIYSAEVERRLPDHLAIRIDRRVPFAYVHFGRTGRWVLLSRDAVVLDIVPRPGQGLYAIEDEQLGNQTPKIGLRLSREFLQLVKIIDTFSKRPLSQHEKITAITMLPNDSVALQLGDLALKLNLNDPDSGQAFDKFEYLLQTENRAMLEYVDLRFNRVILKRKTEIPANESRRNKKR